MIIEVSLSLGLFDTFAYEFKGDPEEIYPGLRVIVPLWNRITTGWVINCSSSYKGKVKPVLGIIRDNYLPDDKLLKFAEKISRTFFVSMGKILDNSLSPQRRSGRNLCVNFEDKSISLDKLTLKKFNNLLSGKPAELFYKNIDNNGSRVNNEYRDIIENNKTKDRILLLKYERINEYKKIWELNRSRGKSVLLILPNNLSMEKYREHIPDINIYNSVISMKLRENIWTNVKKKEPVFIGGGELSLYLPFLDLGTIIVEKPGSFYYSRSRFSGIDIRKVAEIRSEIFNTELVYGSPTYTVSSYRDRENLNVKDQRQKKNIRSNIHRIKPGEKTVPVQVFDIAQRNYLETKKTLIVINKKKSMGFLLCTECKKIEKCSHCGGSVKWQKKFDPVCLKCGYVYPDLKLCKRCNSELKIVMDISAESVRTGIEKRIPGKDILVLNIEDIDKDVSVYKKLSEAKVVISTPAVLNNLRQNTFDSVIFIKPESFFDLNDYNGAELIFNTIADLKEIITEDGIIDVYSAFFFHYSLKNSDDEKGFFERELKYRKFFMLPPYANIYLVEIKNKDLRALGKNMRALYKDFREELNISRIYLQSREKKRGFFKGIMEIHTEAESIIESGLLKKREVTVKRNIL
ncbi:MAG: hypothetical protein ABFR75_07530 [Acidobacteriota bacterium]